MVGLHIVTCVPKTKVCVCVSVVFVCVSLSLSVCLCVCVCVRVRVRVRLHVRRGEHLLGATWDPRVPRVLVDKACLQLHVA